MAALKERNLKTKKMSKLSQYFVLLLSTSGAFLLITNCL